MLSKNICHTNLQLSKNFKQFLIFFRFVPDVQPQGNYSEMFMYNAVRNNEPFCAEI